MSLPETCPHCEAGPGPYVNSYLCGTYLRAGHDAKKHQTKKCVTRQLYAFADRARQLEARLAALEAEAKQAREDEAWAIVNDADVIPEHGQWTAQHWVDSSNCWVSVTAPTIHAAIRALRAKLAGGAR